MKVLIISGTDHKGSTYNIGRLLAGKITSEENISEIFLPRDFGEFCCGCTNCFGKSERECPHFGKLAPLTEIIDSSDILIFTTPVYVYHATGQMKAFLDHYGWRWMVHRPEEKMFSKTGCCYLHGSRCGNEVRNKGRRRQLLLLGDTKSVQVW